MKLPNLENAQVENRKITEYLLSEDNLGGKSGFFAAFGFSIAQWTTLRDALVEHAVTHEIAHMIETKHGVKYIIEGEMRTPDGRAPQVRVVWIVDAGKDAPRFVTAYPREGGNR
jgi:hypothetical protein